jgi:hypothetical protein
MKKSEKILVQGSTIKIQRGWKKAVALSALGAAVLLAPLGPSANAGAVIIDDKSQSRVTVCHKGVTIIIVKSALEVHLAHGDTLGPCVVTP